MNKQKQNSQMSQPNKQKKQMKQERDERYPLKHQFIFIEKLSRRPVIQR